MTENPENPDITHETERRARLTWSLLAEPSDAVALMARERLGSRAALELAREATPTELLAALDGQVPAEAADPGAGTPGARASRALQRWRGRLAAVDVDAVLEDADRRGIRVLIPGDEEWPSALDDLQETAPHCLWVQGPGRLDRLAGERAAALVGICSAARHAGEPLSGWRFTTGTARRSPLHCPPL